MKEFGWLHHPTSMQDLDVIRVVVVDDELNVLNDRKDRLVSNGRMVSWHGWKASKEDDHYAVLSLEEVEASTGMNHSLHLSCAFHHCFC